jgi:hypothetical protein
MERYIRIGNTDDSMKIWIANCIQIDEEKREVLTRCGLPFECNQPYYRYKNIDNMHRTKHMVINKDKHVLVLVRCEPSEADYVCLQYYGGVEIKEVVKTWVDGDVNKFQVRERIYIKSATEEAREKRTGVVEVTQRDNEILGCIYLDHVPTKHPKYEGDCDTIMTVYNKRAFYLKIIDEF